MSEPGAAVWAEEQWRPRAEAYRQHLEDFLGPRLSRIRDGDPVPAFLFSYYSLQPRQLRIWHPGFGAALTGDAAVRAYRGRRGYTIRDGRVTVDDLHLHRRADTVGFVARLLRTTAGRPAQLSCFGLHEWAMVYRSDDVRHGRIPLRLSPAETDAVVATTPLRCTHFDAYRFFTPEFNAAFLPPGDGAPSRATQAEWEQPGCLHANMDLYKWCYKLVPLIDSELLLDCLELAAAAREVDMRASPYDLRDYGYQPIAIEHAAGRAEYVRCQNAIAERAAPLRATLMARCELLLQVAGCT